jgi:hypothetical protein
MPVISNVTSLATPNGQPCPNNAGITTRSAALKVRDSCRYKSVWDCLLSCNLCCWILLAMWCRCDTILISHV